MSDNPCLACSIHQGCCSDLKGLRLSPQEYEANFAHHAAALEIVRDGPQYRVTAKAGPCPNWKDQCTVYDTRPMECRLFPMTVSHVVEMGGHVIALAHDRTGCPQQQTLRPDNETAKAMIDGFLQDAYGGDKHRTILIDEGVSRLLGVGIRALAHLPQKPTDQGR